MIIKTHVLTTTNKQGLSKTQADNARANINAQEQLTTDADSHIKLTPSENGVKIAIDGEIGKTYTSADEDYVKVNNLDATIDLATDAKNALSDVSKKVDKVDGKDLSSNDFTDECLEKLDGIATGAQVNVQSNWNETDETSDAYIQNKPEIYTAQEIDELLDARAVFLKSTDDLPTIGDSSKVYYVGPKTTASGDQYDVYVWNTKANKYIIVDEATISLDGYWHDNPVYDGTGNAITSVTVGKTGLVTFNKESTFALDSDVKTHTDDTDIHITSDEREKWNGYKPNNGRLTFTVNGNELPQVFTANSSENVEIPLTDTTYGEVTIETSGLMSVSDKKKLDGIAEGAEVNVQPDWNEADTTSDAYIKNKPSIPNPANDGKLTFTVNGVKLATEFSADSASNVEIALTDTTYEPATDQKDGLMSSADKKKLDGVAEGAESNVQSDWNDADVTSDAYIKNKPSIPNPANDGKLTFTVNGKKLENEFSADSAADVEIALTDTTYDNATDETAGLMSSEDKKKLDGIAEGAEVNVQVDWNEADTTSDAYIKNKPSIPNPANDGKLTFTVNGEKLEQEFSADSASNVEIALTDTTYDNATDETAGLMSAADKKKLDEVEEGAEVNVQSDWNDADTTSDAYIKNKPTIPNPANDGKLTFTVNGEKLEQEFSADSASNVEIALTDTTYDNATDETAGLMSSEDKKKLDGIAEGAEVNVQSDWNDADTTSDAYIKNKPSIPNPANDGKLTFTVNGEKLETEFSADSASDVEIALTDTTYDNATDEAAGLMSAADKKKLDGIAEGAEVNVQVDWNDSDTTSDAYIKNKPSIPNPANDGKLTFTINGEKLETEFSADSASDVEIALTDTTYDNATETAAGLMSAADKVKLDGIESGAEINQNAFSKVTIVDGDVSTDLVADEKTSQLTLIAGSNISADVDADAKSVTFNADLGADIGFIGGTCSVNVTESNVSVLSETINDIAYAGNNRFRIQKNADGMVMLYALCIKPKSDATESVDGVDMFTLGVNSQLNRTTTDGYYFEDVITVYRDGVDTPIMDSTEFYASQVGKCSINMSLTIKNNAGNITTIEGQDYYGYKILYCGDAPSTESDVITMVSRITAVEETVGIAMYDGGSGVDSGMISWNSDDIGNAGFWKDKVAPKYPVKTSYDVNTKKIALELDTVGAKPGDMIMLGDDGNVVWDVPASSDPVKMETLFISSDNSVDIEQYTLESGDVKVNFTLNNSFESVVTPARPYDKIMANNSLSIKKSSNFANIDAYVFPITFPSGRIESISFFPVKLEAGCYVDLAIYGSPSDTINGADLWFGINNVPVDDNGMIVFDDYKSKGWITQVTDNEGLPAIVKYIRTGEEGSEKRKYIFNWIVFAMRSTATDGGTLLRTYQTDFGGTSEGIADAGFGKIVNIGTKSSIMTNDGFVTKLGADFSGDLNSDGNRYVSPYIQFNIVK